MNNQPLHQVHRKNSQLEPTNKSPHTRRMSEGTSRDVKIAQLQAFQEAELSSLYGELERLDERINKVEGDVLRTTDLVSAARGVVGMRGGTVPCTGKQKVRQLAWANGKGEMVRQEEGSLAVADVTVGMCGVVYTKFTKRFEAPRQSFVGGTGKGVVVVTKGKLNGIVKGSRLWLIYWLDRNDRLWRHFVRPPRAKGGWKVGVFATRSPNRPSPIGLSLCLVEKIDVERGRIFVDGLDVLDETPLIAFKVYDEREACVGVRAGWVDEMARLKPLHYDAVEEYGELIDVSVEFGEGAEERLRFIEQGSAVDIREMVKQSIKRIPIDQATPAVHGRHAHRAVYGSLPVGAFRFLYKLCPQPAAVNVYDVVSGMRKEVCMQEAASDPEAMLHLKFLEMFSGSL